jgi:hypothetical protein
MNSTSRCSQCKVTDKSYVIHLMYKCIKGEVNVKATVHVQITRVTSIYHSYFFLYAIFFGEKPIYKFPGKYCLNVNKQLQKFGMYFFLNIFLFKIKCFCFCFYNLCF